MYYIIKKPKRKEFFEIMDKLPRIIFHIDMNAFFASCEMAVDESLRGKPIVVGHDDPLDRGIIVSPSYEARKYGVHAPMIVREAKKLCPTLIVIPGHYELYQKYSNLFYEYLIKITPLVEMASIDEAYIDLTELNLGPKAIDLAKKIQDDMLKMYKLPCSVGIAPNKFLAKMASDMKKPLGITILRKREIDKMLWPLPIKDMLWIGKKTAPRLESIGIKKIGDVVKPENKDKIIDLLGLNFYNSVYKRAMGEDDTPVITDYGLAQSVSAAHTFINPVYDINLVMDTLKVLVNSVCYRMQKDNQYAENCGIQLRDASYDTKNRSKSLSKATNEERDIFIHAKDVFDDYFDIAKGVRLISVFCNRLTTVLPKETQLSIFDDLDEIERKHAVDKLIREINDTFGKNSVKKGL